MKIAYLIMSVMSSCSFVVIQSMNYPYVVTLLVRHIPFDHIMLCTIGNVNKELRRMLISTASERRNMLEDYIKKQPGPLPAEQQYYAWHPYGSACAYIETFDELDEGDAWNSMANSWIAWINLCSQQLENNSTTKKYINPIIPLPEDNDPQLFPEKSSAKYQQALRSGYLKYICDNHYQTRIGVPFFDVQGNACTYTYDTQDTSCVMHYAIDNEGNLTKYPCSFEYNDTIHSLKLLTRTPFLIPFLHATKSYQNGKEKIYKADSVRIDGKPLTASQHQQIQSYIEDRYLWI